jgi:hypothetical protein
MAYDDSPHTEPVGLTSQSRYQGQSGFREEPEFRGGGAYTGYPATSSGYAGDGAVPAAALDAAFDDPAGGDPSRDRLGVHWVWEAMLLFGVIALAVLLWRAEPDALRGDGLSLLMVYATGFGLLGLAVGITLRAGAPNLAAGPVAAASGAYFAQHGSEGVASTTVTSLGSAAVLGLAVAVLVVLFHVPGWAASLAGAAAAVVWLQMQPAQIPLTGAYDPAGQAAFLFAMVAALGILGGLLGTLRPVRQAVGRFRPAGDPSARRGVVAAMLTGGAIVLSMVLAVVAGVVLVAGEGVPAQGGSGARWLEWTVIGLGVALVGGTSAYGRRGGVFGTTFAVLALVLFDRYQQAQGWEIALLATAATAVAGGLVVTRLVETFGRGDPSDGGPWAPTPSASGQTSSASESWSSATDSWSSALPARPASGSPDPWDDDRWSRR